MAVTNVVKITMVGAGGVGKTSLSMRLVTGDFIETEMTVGFGVESWTKVSESDGSTAFKASIFDMGGQEQFRFFQEALIRKTKLVIIVFDVSSYKTFMAIDEWLPLINEVSSEMRLLVGNKLDEGLIFSKDEIEIRANELGVQWILVSAKSGESMSELTKMIEAMLT
ncbi:MAG: Rab family GTPase [Candidatus Thorarchaeota archaeon]